MRFLTTAICFIACLGLVFCEPCSTADECTATSCNIGNRVVCQFPTGVTVGTINGGLCTCEHSTCLSASECYGVLANLNCPDNIRHCYDNGCICNRFDVVGR
ncbi:hypothetical protein ACF0H5_000943 [Mactra antiquata]